MVKLIIIRYILLIFHKLIIVRFLIKTYFERSLVLSGMYIQVNL